MNHFLFEMSDGSSGQDGHQDQDPPEKKGKSSAVDQRPLDVSEHDLQNRFGEVWDVQPKTVWN